MYMQLKISFLKKKKRKDKNKLCFAFIGFQKSLNLFEHNFKTLLLINKSVSPHQSSGVC